jgi:hypothetical protein
MGRRMEVKNVIQMIQIKNDGKIIERHVIQVVN